CRIGDRTGVADHENGDRDRQDPDERAACSQPSPDHEHRLSPLPSAGRADSTRTERPVKGWLTRVNPFERCRSARVAYSVEIVWSTMSGPGRTTRKCAAGSSSRARVAAAASV